PTAIDRGVRSAETRCDFVERRRHGIHRPLAGHPRDEAANRTAPTLSLGGLGSCEVRLRCNAEPTSRDGTRSGRRARALWTAVPIVVGSDAVAWASKARCIPGPPLA